MEFTSKYNFIAIIKKLSYKLMNLEKSFQKDETGYLGNFTFPSGKK
jgi:hypothetical protein